MNKENNYEQFLDIDSELAELFEGGNYQKIRKKKNKKQFDKTVKLTTKKGRKAKKQEREFWNEFFRE